MIVCPGRYTRFFSRSRLGGGNSFFYFHPYLLGGRWFPFWRLHIFQRGWFNHQLGGQFFVGSNSRTGDWSPSTGSPALAAASVPWMCYSKHIPVEGFSGKFRRIFLKNMALGSAWSGWWILRILINARWWQLKSLLICIPKIGVSWSNLTVAYFQRGWFNHQRGKSWTSNTN